jgi:hypothetical protein
MGLLLLWRTSIVARKEEKISREGAKTAKEDKKRITGKRNSDKAAASGSAA